MSEHVHIRLATDADRARIRRLAELDSSRPPEGDVLLAEVNSRPIAAIGMDGAVVADPFEHTRGAVRLLRAQLAGERRPARRRGLLGRLRHA